MPVLVNIVAQVGRVAAGNAATLPVVSSIAGQFGGRLIGGEGSSTNPIQLEFPDKASAVAAASAAWKDDSVEFAKVVGADGTAAGTTQVNESTGKIESIGSVNEAIDAVIAGADPALVVESLLEDASEITEGKDGSEELHSTLAPIWDKHSTEAGEHPGTDWDKWDAFADEAKAAIRDHHPEYRKAFAKVQGASADGDGPETVGELVAGLMNHKQAEG